MKIPQKKLVASGDGKDICHAIMSSSRLCKWSTPLCT